MSSVEGAGTVPDRAMDGRALGSSYVLETVIGRGATGEVWRGRVRDTEEPVAAKVLDATLAREPDVVARFIHERALLTQVVHPNVITVRDLVIEGDTLAIVMDLVDGTNLRVLLDRSGPLGPVAALDVIDQVLLGLDAVHARGLVHRDLKPENVLVEDSDDGVLHARISDFGIAQLAAGDSAGAPAVLAGTAEYLAPELLDGDAPTPASDLYAVGILLCELVAGRTPFAAEHATAVMHRQLHEPPARPPGMPADLWRRVERLLAKDPARRPDTAASARRLLGLASPGSGSDIDATVIPRVRAAGVAKRAPRSRRWIVAVAMLAVVALVVSALVLTQGTSTAGATLVSAPEYLPDAGKPVVHRVLTIEGNDLRVRVRVTAPPVGGFTITELIPPLVQDRPVTVDGSVTHPDVRGALRLRVPYRASTESQVSYRIALSSDRAPDFLLRYERARVRLLRSLSAADRPDTLVALEVAPAVRVRAGQRAWLPASGRTLAGATDTAVAETLGRSWTWASSNPRVATVVRAHPHDAAPGRTPTANSFRIDANAAGRTVLTTVVAGVPYSVTVTVAGKTRRPVACDPGIVPGSRLQLAVADGEGVGPHPVEGTLIAIGAARTPAVRAVGGQLVPFDPGRDVACAGASVVRLSLAEYGRIVTTGNR